MRIRTCLALGTAGLLVWAAACTTDTSGTNGPLDDGGSSGDGTGDDGSSADGSSGDDGATGDGTTGDATPGDGGKDAGDASDAADANVAPPTLLAITPETGALGGGFVLRADALGVLPGARILFGGTALTSTSAPDAGADAGADAGSGVTSLYGTVPAGLVNVAGSIAVVVENAPGNAGSQSAALFVEIPQTGGGPVVYDIHTDNGIAGSSALLVGQNLGTSVTVTGPNAAVTAASSDGGTISWPNIGVSEVASFTVPQGWQSGQLTVSSDAGAPFRTRVFNVGTNLSPSGSATATTEYGGWPVTRAIDNDLRTSWFAANFDCASSVSCTSVPAVVVHLGAPKAVNHVAIRGNREYASGYDIFRARVEILGADPADAGDAGDAGAPVVFTREVALSNPMRDVDLVVSPPVTGTAVRVVSEMDESIEPGLAEIEVYGN